MRSTTYISKALVDIAAERERQIFVEGFDNELSTAALVYAAHGSGFDVITVDELRIRFWPWAQSWFKPTEDRRRSLVKAAALIAAEIEKMDRRAGLDVRHKLTHPPGGVLG